MTSTRRLVELRREPHTVYVAWDFEGRPLYVGCTYDLTKRMRQHKYTSPWYPLMTRLTTSTYPTWWAGRMAEKDAIRDLEPWFNQTRMVTTTHFEASILTALSKGESAEAADELHAKIVARIDAELAARRAKWRGEKAS